MKIIDFELKGNVIRFYLGDDDCNDYWGDDWNDAPYEHNAGTVYNQYVKAVRDVAVGFDHLVLEPKGNWRGDSRYSKEDMKNRLVPCVIIVPKEICSECYYDEFSYYVGSDNITSIYFGDDADKVVQEIERLYKL